MAALLDLCRFVPTAGGTSDWTFSSAVVGYQSPTLAGVVNTRAYKYRAESADLSQWELGEGTYNTGTGVLTRTTVLYNSSGTGTGVGQTGAGNKINFSTTPQVAMVITKEDFLSVEEDNTFTATQRTQARKNISAPIKGAQFGCILSAAGGSTSFGVTAGDWADSTGVDLLTLGSAFTKTTAAWAVGTGNGALDTAALTINTWYHVYLIKRPDTGVVDIIFSLSPIAPTLPTNYTLFRRIGSIATNSLSQWNSFTQIGDNFWWTVSIRDVNNSSNGAIGTTATTFALSVPLGVVVYANIALWAFSSGASSYAAVYPLFVTDQSVVYGTFGNLLDSTSGGGNVTTLSVPTNTSGQVRARGSVAGSKLDIDTLGWIDTRGRLSP